MRDQAEKLRLIIENLKMKQAANQAQMLEKVHKRIARVITITSGKGGVGKTNVTINLAIALSDLGYRVIILDADFGLANIDVLFGISPQYTLADVINDKKNIVEILSEGPNRIKFISGGSGVEELVKLEKKQLERFIENMLLLDKLADIILIDTGAGLSDNVMSFLLAADEVLLVTTPEPTSITDAYALIKMLVNRDKEKNIKVVINKAENQGEAEDILKKFSLVSEKFLSVKLHSLGYILNDDNVSRAVKMQTPFMLSFPKSPASRYVRDICRKLVDVKDANNTPASTGVRSFINRLVGFFSQ